MSVTVILGLGLLLQVAFGPMDSGTKVMPCNLVWKPMATGEPLPEDAVPSHGTEHYIARGKWGSFWDPTFPVSGRVERSEGVAYLPWNGVQSRSFYDVLTNPNHCAISWVTVGPGGTVLEPQFAVSADGGTTFVARGSPPDSNNLQLGGKLEDDFFWVAFGGQEHKILGGAAKSLRSTINLRLNLTQFQFQREMGPGTEDFLGIDIIENETGVNVTQTVVHRKTVINKYSFTDSSSFNEVSSFGFSLKIPFPGGSFGLDFGMETTEADGTSETVAHEEEHEVVSSRTILVPPHTSVQACSTVSIQSDFKMPYTALGKYTIHGFTALEVRGILQEEGGHDIIGTEGKAVLVRVNGEMVASLPTKTRFVITEKGDLGGCTEIQRKINALWRDKAFRGLRNEDQILRQEEIDSLISRKY